MSAATRQPLAVHEAKDCETHAPTVDSMKPSVSLQNANSIASTGMTTSLAASSIQRSVISDFCDRDESLAGPPAARAGKPAIGVEEPQMSLAAGAANLCNSIIGSGILALSLVAGDNGVLVYAMLLILAAVLAGLTHQLLFQACWKVGALTFEQLGFKLFGSLGAPLTACGILMQGLGSMCTYTFIFGQMGSDILAQSAGMDADVWQVAPAFLGLSNRSALIIGIVIIVCLPLAMVPSFRLLRYSSYVAVTVMASFATAIVVNFFVSEPGPGVVRLVPSSASSAVTSLLTDFPEILFGCNSHHVILGIYSELKVSPNLQAGGDQTVAVGRSRLAVGKRLSVLSYFIVVSVYMTVGIMGYCTFRSKTKDDLLQSFPSTTGTSVLRAAVFISVLLGYPNVHMAVRRALLNLYLGPTHPACVPGAFTRYHAVSTVIVVSSCTVIAIICPSLKVAISFTGALASTYLLFVLPAVLYMKAFAGELSRGMRTWCIGLIVFGCSLAIICTSANVYDLVRPVAPHSTLSGALQTQLPAPRGFWLT